MDAIITIVVGLICFFIIIKIFQWIIYFLSPDYSIIFASIDEKFKEFDEKIDELKDMIEELEENMEEILAKDKDSEE